MDINLDFEMALDAEFARQRRQREAERQEQRREAFERTWDLDVGSW